MPQTDRNVSLATLTHAGMYSLVWPFGMAAHGNAAVSLQRHAAHEASYCAFTVCDTRAVDEHYSLSWPPKLEVIEPKGHVTRFRGINCAFLHLLSARKDLL